MSKAPSPIAYPNNIDHHPTVLKLREIIDHANSLKTTVDQNLATVQATAIEQAATIAALPTSNDVNMSIATATGKNGVITQAMAKIFGLTPVAAGTTLEAASRLAPRAPVRVSGPRNLAPEGLGPEDAGMLFYCTDYAHLCLWDGWAWQLSDPGGYMVDSTLDLGVGWQLCDGTATDYLVNDTPGLEVRGFTTPNRRFRRQFFRR